jgi:teichoic acid transport system permease protein
VNETDYASLAREAGLTRVGARPTLPQYLAEAWHRRSFAITLAAYRIRAANEQNRLGLAWVVLRPLLNAVVYGVIFGIFLNTQATVADSAAHPPSFISYLIVGVFIFEFFNDSFSDGAKAVIGSASLVRSLSFPRILLPIASVLQSLFELVPMVIIMFAIVALFGEPVTWTWLLVFPVLALMTMFNAGVALIAARITTRFRDFRQIIQLITRIMFYTTGVFFALETVLASQPTLLFLARLNPVHDYIALIRWAIVENSVYDPIFWWIGGSAAVVFLIGGILYFWHAEETYGRD